MTTSGPPVTDLHGWVRSSLALTRRVVAALDHPGPDVDAPPLDREKVVGEALLLLRATSRVVADSQANQVWRALRHEVAPLARPDSLAASVCLQPGRALESAFTHIQLSALGDADPVLDALVTLAVAEPRQGPEPYVVAALHREWLRGLHEGRPDLLVLDSLLARSSLGGEVDVLRCTTQDVYDLTHAVMHGTDLGSWPVTLPRPAADLTADLDALLGIALDAGEQGNLDLTTEVLWAWPMLRLPMTQTTRLALAVLRHAHRRHGFLPGPGYEDGVRMAMTPAAGHAYVLRTSYHATLVLGVLAAGLLTAGDRPAAERTAVRSGSAARLLDGLGGGPARAWRSQVPSDADGLSRMLLSVALRRACDDYDLLTLRRLLELAVELDIADGRAVGQAASLLRRSAALVRSRVTAAAGV